MNALGSRYVQLLQGQPDPNNGTIYGGLASALQKGMMGYAMGQDRAEEEAKQGRLAQALQMYSGSPGTTVTWNQQRPDGTGDPTTTYGAQAADPMGAANLIAPDNPGLALDIMQQERELQNQQDDPTTANQVGMFVDGQGSQHFGTYAEALNNGWTIAPDAPDPTTAERNAAAMGLTPGSPEWNQYINSVTQPASVRVETSTPPQETEFERALGQYWGEQYGLMQQGAAGAGSMNANLDQMSELLDQGLATGAGAGTMLDYDKLALAISDRTGFDLGVDPETVGSGEAMRALGNKMALELRNPANGAGMPGSMSDSDREFLTASMPGLGMTPEGNRILIGLMRKVNDRKIQVARLADQYILENSTLNAGFNDYLAANLGNQPLVTAEDRAATQLVLGAPATGALAPSAGTGDATPPQAFIDDGFAAENWGTVSQGVRDQYNALAQQPGGG
jgi:hypothetical protein